MSSKLDIFGENLDTDQINTIFQISEKVQTNDHYPVNKKVLKKKIFNPKP